MADDLVFKVKFDLQKGVDEALKDGDKALERIEKALGKHPITIKLRMDDRVARGASAELTGFKKQLAELTQQWNSLTAAERGSAAGAAIREKFRALRTEAQGYTSTLQAAVKAEDKMRESHSKTAASANKLSSAYHNQSTYLSRLIQRMAAYAGVSYVGNFLTNVREVTAQFELQRISLGAIIQDQQRANQLFEEIKTFALKSPVKILDLTKYTKQLAAYKIGVDELFDTTKRLTDISVGLGVSMDRIVLMYGQIRATGYLRASEVRQATEAGIPLVEELAKKLSKANGELVTAADVMDMISKRAISFDMVKEVFDDMTSAGGIFYNMQEKQGNTLFGMWQKLGDAAAVMYDQIGNTDSVNEGMKMAIQSLRYLMLHWKQVGIVVGGVSVYILANTIATKNNAIATAAATTANQSHVATLERKLAALRLEQMHLKSSSIFVRLHTAATISATKAQIGAATSTNVFSKALYGLKAALLSNPLTALAVALTTIIALLMQSESELDKLNSKLQDIDRDYDASGKKSVDRFKELVKAVEENVDGSKAQKEALDELDRTYGKILGSEALELDSLKALGGQYGELIDLIDAYNAKKRGEEKETAIKSSYATILDEEKDDLKDYLNATGMSAEKQAEFISRLNERMIEYAGEANAAIKATNETFAEFADDFSSVNIWGNAINLLNVGKLIDAWGVSVRDFGGWFGGQGMDYLYNYARAMEGQNKALEENEIATRNAVRGLDEYAEGIDNVGKALKNLDWSSQESLKNSLQNYNKKNPQTALSVPVNLEFDPAKAQSEYEKMIEMGNMQIHAIFANLQNIASQEGVAIPEEFYKQAKSVVEGNKSFSFIDFEGLSKLFTSKKAKQAVAESKLLFESISPNDRTVAVFRTKLAQLASGAGVELSSMTKYFMKAGDNIEDYAKKIKEAIEDLEKELNRMQTTNQMLAEGGHGPLQGFSEEEIKEVQKQVAVLKALFPALQGFIKGGSTRTSDPRLQNLKEEISLTKKLYDEYHKLEKQIGATKATEKIQKIYSNTIKALQDRAGKYGFEFELPFTDENLKANMQHFIDKMKELQKLRNKKGKPLFPSIGKEIDEAVAQLEDVDLNSLQKALEKKLKALADRISRTKTAKEFYEKILRLTRNEDLAFRATFSVFGQDKLDTFTDEVEQLKQDFGDVDISATINLKTKQIDYKALREIWEADKTLPDNIRKIPQAYDSTIKSILDAGDKLSEKQFERWGKDLERARDYADKRIELAEYTATQIAEIEAKRDSLKPEGAGYEQQRAMYDEMIRGYREREKNEAAKLDYEQIKEQIGMFDDLGVRIGSAFENILNQLREYTQSPDFARLGLEAQKNVYLQIAKIEDRMAEGFQGIGIGTVSEYVRQYSTAAREYLTAQNNLREATLKAIEADKEWERVKNSNDEAAKSAALAEKTLADSRVRTAAVSVNAAGANLQRAQEGAARASAKFNTNLQKIDSSLRSLNNGALKALWDLIGDKGKRSVGEFLSGSRKMLKAIERMDDVMAKSGATFEGMGDTLRENIADALAQIDPSDLEGMKTAVNDTLVATFMEMGANEELAKKLAEGLSEGVTAALSSVASGEKGLAQAAGEVAEQAAKGTQALKAGIADGAAKTGEMWGAIISLILSLLDEFAENGIGTFLGDLLDNVAGAVEGILSQLLTESIPRILQGVANVIKGVGLGLGDLFTGGAFDLTGVKAVKRANREIEHQQDLLDELEYRYERLGKAIDKAFGVDYVNKYNAQIENLQAQAAAYKKMADAERSKGKKADDDKIDEYLKSYRDVMDEIADMQGQIAAQMFGTDLTSAARDFAQAWLDAYKEFGNTADAMSEKFHEMIENMIVESLLARAMEKALKPAFDMIDSMGAGDFYSPSFWEEVVAKAEAGAQAADKGAGVMMRFLEDAGVQVRDLGAEYSGIAREIAGASEESVTGLAAGINTQNYYIAQQLSEVQAIRQLLERGRTLSAAGEVPTVDTVALWNRHLELQQGIYEHTRRSAERCEEMAALCTQLATDVHRVVVPKGQRGSFGVQVWT